MFSSVLKRVLIDSLGVLDEDGKNKKGSNNNKTATPMRSRPGSRRRGGESQRRNRLEKTSSVTNPANISLEEATSNSSQAPKSSSSPKMLQKAGFVNDGSAFNLAERKKSLSSVLANLPRFATPKSVLLLKGEDCSEHFTPHIPHRLSASPRYSGALLALLTPSSNLSSSSNRTRLQTYLQEREKFLEQQQRHETELRREVDHHPGEGELEQQRQLSAEDDDLAPPSSSSSSSSRSFFTMTSSSLPTSSLSSSSSTSSSSSSSTSSSSSSSSSSNSTSYWRQALEAASRNIALRGGERSSEDTETTIETLLLHSRKRRQAFDAFLRDKDEVPLKHSTYDLLLRTFITDRGHIIEILDAMKKHKVYQEVLESGERSEIAQSVFEALSLHDIEEGLKAFDTHSSARKKKMLKQQQRQSKKEQENNVSLSSTSSGSAPPVYSGLISQLIKRASAGDEKMKGEAKRIMMMLTTTQEPEKEEGENQNEMEKKESSSSQKQKQGIEQKESFDAAIGLIRCLHNEVDQNQVSSLEAEKKNKKKKKQQQLQQLEQVARDKKILHSSSRKNALSVILKKQQQEEEQGSVDSSSSADSNVNSNCAVEFAEMWLQKASSSSSSSLSSSSGSLPLRGQLAIQIYQANPSPFTCAALSRFLLQHYPNRSTTKVVQSAVSETLFSHSSSSSHHHHHHHRHHHQHNQHNNNASSQSLISMAAATGGKRQQQALQHQQKQAQESNVIHLARLAVSRTVNRHQQWQLALSIAQSCLRTRSSFEAVAPLAATVARSGRWSQALRLGTQLFALRRSSSPSVSELSLCVHCSLWSGKWSSALFFIERGHSRGAKFDPAVYDAAIEAAAASATSSSASANNNNNNQHTFDGAVRTLQAMSQLGASCSQRSIEHLIAAASSSSSSSSAVLKTEKHHHHQSKQGGEEEEEHMNQQQQQQLQYHHHHQGQQQSQQHHAPKIIDALCDSDMVDWKF